MRKLFAIAAALVSIASTSSAFAQQLYTDYLVRGWNANGSQYTGVVKLFYSPRLDAYSVTWNVAGTQYDGSGAFLDNGRFEVSYPGGIAYYTVKRNGMLEGVWGANNRSLTGREVWTPR